MIPRTFLASDHDIDPLHIDSDALYVIKKLHEAGHTAYLVGGSVRDLLKGLRPKDYDISTSALPEEVKKLFRNRCILIGRRFRLAHVRFGTKIFEVSTFRSGDNDSELIVRDNNWGSPEEDAQRRDFTVNGLFYDPETHSIIDYVGGWDDIHKNILRTIGEAKNRFMQDPVRMIRLLKFVARFNFDICEEAQKALLECKKEITKSAPPRLLEELLRMLESGHAHLFIVLLYRQGFLKVLLPEISAYIDKAGEEKALKFLEITDSIINGEDKTLHRSILAAALFFPLLEHTLLSDTKEDLTCLSLTYVLDKTSQVMRSLAHTSFIKLPKNLFFHIEYILVTQFRLSPLNPKHAIKTKQMLYHDFEDALYFFKLRALGKVELLDSFATIQHRYRQTKSQKNVHHAVKKHVE
jgi:poly(A) polymerase